MYLTRKFIIGHILVCLAATTCFMLSYWQFSRLSERKKMNSEIERAMDMKPVELSTLIVDLNVELVKSNKYRDVLATGSYIESSQALISSRTNDGEPGYNVVTGFKTLNKKIVFVNRGWIPQSLGDDMVSKAIDDSLIKPEGGYSKLRTIVGMVRVNESKRPFSKDKKLTESNNVAIRISSDVFINLLDKQNRRNVYPMYLQLSKIDLKKQGSNTYPKIIPKPELTLRNHLSYAIQWISFGFIAIITWIIICIKAKKKASA